MICLVFAEYRVEHRRARGAAGEVGKGGKYLGNAQVLDGGDLVSCGSTVLISMELNPKCVVSVLFSKGTHLGDRARVL